MGTVTSDLLDHHINLVAVFHVQLLGGLGLVEALTIEEKTDVAGGKLCEDVLRSVADNRHP